VVDAFPTALNFKGSEEFQRHLASKAKDIKSKLQTIFTNLSSNRGPPSENLQDLQSKLTKLLAAQKESLIKIDRLRTEKEELSERLETASLRYIKAEKRLDRAKSTAVAKLEQQAIAGTGNSAGSGIGGVENGDVEMTNGIADEASQTAYKEAAAVVEKQKEQLDAITAESKSLTEQLTAANLRLSNLTEDDYARTELFKQFRIQHEDVIKRINHLEATNIQLREEAEKYQAERTAYRTQVENEQEMITSEIESQLARVEADLTRVRSARDELIAEAAMIRASRDHERSSGDHLKELVAAKDDRITALEQEVRRLKAAASSACEPMTGQEIESLGLEELQSKYRTLVLQFEAINNELPAMQSAYTKMQGLAHKKVMDLATLEDKVQILSAEKAKADQKYFAARKDMDTRLGEVRALRAQNAKSSEIISQLKDVEISNRSLLSNLEKQLSDMRQANTSTVAENKKMEAVSREATSKAIALKNQVADLSTQLKAKDQHNANTKQKIIEVEQEVAQLRVKYEQSQKDCEIWKKKSLSNQSSEEEMLRVGFLMFVTYEYLLTTLRPLLYAPSVAKISRTPL
jgi:E3 ubiquitin-protein ligase BRE1